MTMTKWTDEKRLMLSEIIKKQGYSPVKIAYMLEMSPENVRNELKRGLEQEEYRNRQYVKYDPEKAAFNEIVQYVGENRIKKFNEYCESHNITF